jgi:uncharacterized protein
MTHLPSLNIILSQLKADYPDNQTFHIFVCVKAFTMSSDKNTITLIKEVVNTYLPGAELVLFGSRARGEEILSSDYDLLVIVSDLITDRQRLHFQAQIRKALAKKLIQADILVQSQDAIRKKQRLPGHIVRTAMKEGIRV